MRFAVFVPALLALLSCAFAVGVLAPISAQVEHGSSITIGNVGPGQTFSIVVGPKVSTGGAYGTGGAYDQLSASYLPQGWESVPSKLYATPLQIDITVPKDAPDGDYEVGLKLWDEAGELGLGADVEFSAKVTVTHDVMDMTVAPTSISTGAGQPAIYAITIANKGMANDVFVVGSTGVRTWEFRRSVYIPSQTTKTLNYELVGDEEADYDVTIWARSSSSDRIGAEVPVELRVNTDLLSDLKALNKGVLLFPSAEAPLYFIVGLLSNFLP
ncbi:MAG: hypothetical protein WC717_03825 [Candidatus Micrarchaeia archaeon]|jgi:hypothetical protein